MKIISWNIRGCNHPRNIKTLSRKMKQEKPDLLFLQETKCSFEFLMRISQRIWKGSSVMAMDAKGMEGRGGFLSYGSLRLLSFQIGDPVASP